MGSYPYQELKQEIYDYIFDNFLKSDMGERDPYVKYDKDRALEHTEKIMNIVERALRSRK